MSYELDMSQYLDLFLTEAREQLEILEQETIKLEEDASKERLQVIFRSAHTLKGSARAMGFQNFAELTHEMENVLDNLRNDIIEISTSITDALLNCLDILKEMVEKIEAGQGDASDCNELVGTLQGFVGTKAEVSKKATVDSKNAGSSPQVTSEDTFVPIVNRPAGYVSKLDADHADSLKIALESGPILHLHMRLTDDCAMKFVRAFMAISEIQSQGELLLCIPSTEDLEEENFEHEFELFFQTPEDIATLMPRIERISEVAGFVLDSWTGSDAGTIELNREELAPQKLEVITNPLLEAEATTEVKAIAPSAAIKKPTETGQTVRVDVTRLDSLMNLVGELVIDRTRIAQIGAELSSKFDDVNIEALAETVGHIHRITSDLQDQIMKARMMPIESVFNRFPRVVRDLAQKLGKEIKLEVSGGETELDRSVIEVIGDPLLHILRNSIDHGIEMPDERIAAGKPANGTVTLSAKHQENHIVIEIIDDGKGIDVERIKTKAIDAGLATADAVSRMSDKEALQFIFASGLSTAVEVSEVSGRGVGMDIVRSNILKLSGIIDLETVLGVGTKFSLRLPLTLAIIRGLLVNVNATTYVIPLGSVVETMLIDKSQIQSVNRKEVVVIRGVTTPLVRLNNFLKSKCTPTDLPVNDQSYVVIVGLAEQRVGLIVDNLIGEREVVIKSISRFVGDVPGVSGATILGDGNVALIMDVNNVMKQARS